MSTVLDYYGQYNPESNLDWKGLKSSKFAGTRKHFAPRDSFCSSFQIAQNNQKNSGRKHFEQTNSPQQVFRSTLRKIQYIPYQPRHQSKKIVQLKLTQPHPRRQKLHLTPLKFNQQKTVGLRTFYNLNLRKQGNQYSIQNKMQRKVRINQSELRRTFFQNQSKSLCLNTTRF